MQSFLAIAEIFEDMGNRKKRRNAASTQPETIKSPEVLDEKIKNVRRIGWAVIGIYLALFGGLITWYLPNQLSNLRELIKGDTTSKIEPLQRQLDQIQGELSKTASLNSAETLERLSKSDPKALSASLSQLRRAVQQPPNEVNAEPKTLRSLARKLMAISSSSPDYWPAVLGFIQFASASMVKPSNVPPPGNPQIILSHVSSNTPNGIKLPVIRHKIVLLDGGELWDATFYHCRIIFTDSPMVMHNFKFIDCIFQMPSTANNPAVRDAARELLSSDLTEIKGAPS